MAKVTQLTSMKWLREKYPEVDGVRLVDKLNDAEILEFFADSIQVPELKQIIIDKLNLVEIVDVEIAYLRHMKHNEESLSPTD